MGVSDDSPSEMRQVSIHIYLLCTAGKPVAVRMQKLFQDVTSWLEKEFPDDVISAYTRTKMRLDDA